MEYSQYVVNGSFTQEQRLNEVASKDVTEVLSILETRSEGHYNEEVTTSRIKYGKNEITSSHRFAVLKRLYHSFVNIFTIALAFFAFMSVAMDNWTPSESTYIVTTLILVSGVLTFVQETRGDRAASKLVSMVTTMITVRREGVEIEIDSKDLVVGDILILDTGDVIPADVRIIVSNHLKVDQSALTGESVPVTKDEMPDSPDKGILGCSNMAFSGTNVVSGSAEAVVVAVGDNTIFGSMAAELNKKKDQTTYDKGSKKIVKLLLSIMCALIPCVFLIMSAKQGWDIWEPFLFAVALAIGLMPEMLATIVATNLAKGSIDMAKKKVIVKDVNSIQNLGAMDVLCSDKTGTLTHNRISVRECNNLIGCKSPFVSKLAVLNSYNLTAATNQIDWAIDEFAEANDLVEDRDSYEYVADMPFDFIKRRATVVVKDSDGDQMIISKGAIPEILSISSAYRDEDGNICDLDDRKANDVLGMIEWYSSRGMRMLGVAYRNIELRGELDETDEHDMILAGFVVFVDPVKESAKEAVQGLKDYNVDVKVLTGDNEYVTGYVCNELGISTENALVGPDVDNLSDNELRDAVETCHVFARLTPDHKARIVKALRANGHTVGLIGDGINDTVAMRASDVSLSVDIASDIAKETANMILLEKDLNVLKQGAIEGRKVYVNSVKYVKMIASINFGYMFSLIIAACLFQFEPIGDLQILIFNLVNDFACLVIPWDKVEDEYVRMPRKWDPTNLKRVMVRYGPMCCITDIITWTCIILLFLPAMGFTADIFSVTNGSPEAHAFQSIWFVEQFWMQVWAIHIVRTDKVPFLQSWSSPILVVTTILALAFGTILPFTAVGQSMLELVAIPWQALVFMPCIALIYFTLSAIVKKGVVRKYGSFAC